MAMTAIQFLDIIESKLPDNDEEAAAILDELIEYLEEKYEGLISKK